MRIGFVGVGSWAQQLATAFKIEGGKIVCHARSGSTRADRFGLLVSADDVVAYDGVDLVVVAADPDTTTRVAQQCANAGKPCVATKPLLSNPDVVGAPFYVDFWRIWSPAYLALRDEVRGQAMTIDLDFYGNGPFRPTMGGLLDYGPHAFAYIHDLLSDQDLMISSCHQVPTDNGELFDVEGHVGGAAVAMTLGNGDHETGRRVLAVTTIYGRYELVESDGCLTFSHGNTTLVTRKEDALRKFAKHVIRAVEIDRWDNRTLVYSRLAEHGLQSIRAFADRGTDD